ncbi:MAG TPA: tail fiber domain-containing protein [Casimicrobiaceae bacterium]|jgi:hypothetical protein|nr:tail fiber domain-containing protein [Casimicrobiaceae bacterium]
MVWRVITFCLAAFLVYSQSAVAQTTAGASATIVLPIVAQTPSFGSEVTVYNPNAGTITITPAFYDAQNTSSPGPKACGSLSVAANVSKQLSVASQCALPAGAHFGLLVLPEVTGTRRFYGYARTQTPQGVGFSTEGFPIENFNDQIQDATGLKRVAATGGSPALQTNCFAATLADAVDYELRLFDGDTGTELGTTLSGSLQPFQMLRYLDVFAASAVGDGDLTNVRAQFTNLTGNEKKLIGFCTVQENTTLSAAFVIAKSYGGTLSNAFVQGGDSFGTTALLGTTDDQPLEFLVNGERVARFELVSGVPNVISGYSGNTGNGNAVVTVAGGGIPGMSCGAAHNVSCSNQAAAPMVTIGGGFGNVGGGTGATIAGGYEHDASGDASTIGGGNANVAGDLAATVAGGSQNRATGFVSTIGGGSDNVASGSGTTVVGGANNVASGDESVVAGGNTNSATGFFATVAGGGHNVASGRFSFVAGRFGKASGNGTFVWADLQPNVNVFEVVEDNVFAARATGGVRFVTAVDETGAASKSVTFDTNGNVNASGTFNGSSDRNAKEDIAEVDPSAVLAKLSVLPISTWRYRTDALGVTHMGPMAQDFREAFGLGADDKHIATVDADGVALAAIKALYRLIVEKDTQIEAQRQQIEGLQKRIGAIEQAANHR